MSKLIAFLLLTAATACAIGHCLLMLFAGTFTGFVEGFVKARCVVNFSFWAKRVSGLVVATVGGWFVWQGLGI
jgi:cytochrome c-type biogenesis protein